MFRAIMQLSLDLDLSRPDLTSIAIGLVGFPLARVIRRGAKAAAAQSDQAHELLVTAGFDQVLLDEGLARTVESEESLLEPDDSLV